MKINQNFVHLRSRSSYSLAEGAIKINDLIDLAVANNMPALTLTDNGNLFGALEFSIAAVKKGIQPIIGSIIDLETLEADCGKNINTILNPKIVLIAQNETGWKNLSILVTKSFLDSDDSNQRPLKLKEIFQYSKGLICLLGGVYGPVGYFLLKNNYDEAHKVSNLFKNNFHDRVFMEIMRHGLEEEKFTENSFVSISSDLDIPLVATNNIYFNKASMYEAHDCLMCISQGVTLSNSERFRINNSHYFKSITEMVDSFSDIPVAIDNSILIAKKCSLLLEECAPSLPSYPKNITTSEHEVLIKDAELGLSKRLGDNTSSINSSVNNVYLDRLKYELNTIEKMGFSGYFLIVAEFVNWAKDNDIPVGPGRGSGAGSVVAWALGITNLDPIKFNLLFERFLNPERISMPDFDIDFCQIKRDEVIEHVKDTYGQDRVAQIITFGSLQARGVLRDVGRVLEIPYSQVDELCRLIPIIPGTTISLKEAINNEPRLAAAKESGEEILQLFEISEKLEGLHRNASTHAAGVVIGNKSLVEILPLYKDVKANLPATQFNMKYTELSGLVKFDFLGLKTLSILDMASKLLRKSDKEFHLDKIPLDDSSTFKLISSAKTIGVFQLESEGMKDVLQKLKPDCFEDIIAVVALYRPGPMENIPSFIDRKHGKEDVAVLHPLLEDILKPTYGVIIYQEQVMQIAQKLSGFTAGQADLLRRAMGKKIKSEMDAQKENFVSGAKSNGINKEISSKIFELISPFAGYAFNKSHAAAYALIAYQTAWFKANHPEIFLASLMTFDSDNSEKVAVCRNELSRLKINILGPDINFSEVNYSIEKGKDAHISIRTGLCSIKNIGNKALNTIVEDRLLNGKYKSLLLFSSRIGKDILGKSHYEFLASSGAFDSISKNRKQAFMSAEILSDLASSVSEEKNVKQGNIFDNKVDLNEIWKLPNISDWEFKQRLENERSSLGFYFSGHPLKYYENFTQLLDLKNISNFNNTPEILINTIGVVFQVNERSSRKGRFMRVLLSGYDNLFEVTVYNEIYHDKKQLLVTGKEVFMKLIMIEDDNGIKRFIVKELDSITNKIEEYVLGFNISLESNINAKEFFKLINNHFIQGLDCKQKNLVFNLPLNINDEAIVNIYKSINSIVPFYNSIKTFKGVKSIDPFKKI